MCTFHYIDMKLKIKLIFEIWMGIEGEIDEISYK